MVILSCLHCDFSVIVIDDPESVSLYFDPSFNPERDEMYSCPRCRGSIKFGVHDETVCKSRKDRKCTAHEAHLALSQMGFPEEQECPATRVKELFKEQPVLSLDIVDIPNTNRSQLRCINFADGSRLHLAAGGSGVTVYRISRPRHEEDRT